MNRIKVSNNFWLDEYIPEHLYREFMDRPDPKPHILIGLIDRRVIIADQKLREHFGPVTINNWWYKGVRNWSGIRTPGSPYFSNTSQHTFGRASDKIFANATAEEVRNYIRIHHLTLGITCIEQNTSWVHSDVRWHEFLGLYEVPIPSNIN